MMLSRELLGAIYATVQPIMDTQPQQQSGSNTLLSISETNMSTNSTTVETDTAWIKCARQRLGKWPEWDDVLRLADCLAYYIDELLKNEENVQLQGICAVVFGCLYLRCASPYSPMDPYLVHQMEQVAISNEVSL